ncbi:hypothetical protein [Peribacillus sp. SI8-4]|nr:hypothetical protein [Peribacillus sp. SI8-4]
MRNRNEFRKRDVLAKTWDMLMEDMQVGKRARWTVSLCMLLE